MNSKEEAIESIWRQAKELMDKRQESQKWAVPNMTVPNNDAVISTLLGAIAGLLDHAN